MPKEVAALWLVVAVAVAVAAAVLPSCHATNNLLNEHLLVSKNVGGHQPSCDMEEEATGFVATDDDYNNNHNQPYPCSLFLAPSSIDHEQAGLGLFAGRDYATGDAVGESDLYIALEDALKTLPYRGHHRFKSWLGYIWPSRPDALWHQSRSAFPALHPSHYLVNEGLNAAAAADGEGRPFVDAGNDDAPLNVFGPGVPSLINSHRDALRVNVQRTASSLHPVNTNSTPTALYYGAPFSATRPIAAGSELFLSYGELWHERFQIKYGSQDGYRPFEVSPQDYMPGKGIRIPTEAEKRHAREEQEQILARNLVQRFRRELMQQARDHAHRKPPSETQQLGSHNNGTNVLPAVTAAKAVQEPRVQTKGTEATTTVPATDNRNDEKDDAEGQENEEDEVIPEFGMGTVVYEVFDDEWFYGTIVDYKDDHDVYEILYEDGETLYYHAEDDRDQLEEIIANALQEEQEHPRHQRQRQRQSQRQDQKQQRRLIQEVELHDEQLQQSLLGGAAVTNTTRIKGASSHDWSNRTTWLAEHGVCVDQLQSGTSTIPGAGRGAFSKRFIPRGGLVAPAPLIVIPRDDLTIYQANLSASIRKHVLQFDQVVGYELLLNYCYGHAESSILLLPYAPGVNFINHNGKDPNVVIQWPTSSALLGDPRKWLDMHPLDLLNQSGKLMMEFVALRDIQPGEEITIDYGSEWQNAWDAHNDTKDAAAEFRHEIGVPPAFFPETWFQKAKYELANQDVPLHAGDMDELRWAHNGERVAEGLLRVGLPKGLSARMREYAEERGIIGIYERLITDSYLENDGWHVIETINNEHWFVHRYMNTAWKFNMHYVGAWDEIARQSFFRALGQAGFDEVLDGLGKHFGYDHMTCFHFSFMGLSEADDSFTHADVYATGKKGFNLIFPLITVEDSEPELDIISEDANIELAVNYVEDVAYVLADWGYHKTSPNDNKGGQLRLVASLYCGQIDETNAQMMAHIYDGEEPAPFMSQFDLPIQEYHWGKGYKLPQ